MTRKQKHLLTRIIVAAVLFLQEVFYIFLNLLKWEYFFPAM